MAFSTGGSSNDRPSRAVKIPHRDSMQDYSSTPVRQRRSGKHNVHDNLIDQTDNGASSLSSESSSSASSLFPSTMLTRLKPNSSTRKRHEDRQAEHHLPGFSTTSLSSSEDSYETPVGSSKQKAKVIDASEPPNTMPSLISARSSPLGPSMLSSPTYKSINLNGPDPDEPPRLITFTKAGQGFNWNEELFLPSYMISRYSRSRRKQYDGDLGEDDVEVAEISVTDEEANNMMP